MRYQRRFFRHYAGQNHFRHHLGVTYVAVEDGRMLGFATVAPRHISIEALPDRVRKKLPWYPVPVLGLARLAVDRSAQSMIGRPIVDETGLAGRFEVSTAFDPRSEPEALFYPAEDLSSLPSLRDALRHDLGFTLEMDRRDFPVLVVEHIEQPTEN